MKKILTIILSLLLFSNLFGQQIDTLKVIVLSPNKIEVSENCLEEYHKIQKDYLDKRKDVKLKKSEEKQSNIEDYNKLPEYSRIMFDNEFNFYDDLTIDNYVSMAVREYVSYRLYKPFKIKPRLVLVSKRTSVSDLNNYSEIDKGSQNFFIINFPTVKVFKENGEIKVQTEIELYSRKTNEILLSKENIGNQKSELTDYPICSGENLDCAIVNSVYPELYNIIKIISERNADKK